MRPALLSGKIACNFLPAALYTCTGVISMPTKEDEAIEKIARKIAQLRARKKLIENKQRSKAKKERTRRLIKFGELVEKYLRCETAGQLEAFLRKHSTHFEASQQENNASHGN